MQVIADNKITKLRQRHGIQRGRLVATIARHSQETLATQRLSKDNATQRGILTRFDASREELARKSTQQGQITKAPSDTMSDN